jgi:hypothetical protein
LPRLSAVAGRGPSAIGKPVKLHRCASVSRGRTARRVACASRRRRVGPSGPSCIAEPRSRRSGYPR